MSYRPYQPTRTRFIAFKILAHLSSKHKQDVKSPSNSSIGSQLVRRMNDNIAPALAAVLNARVDVPALAARVDAILPRIIILTARRVVEVS